MHHVYNQGVLTVLFSTHEMCGEIFWYDVQKSRFLLALLLLGRRVSAECGEAFVDLWPFYCVTSY